MGQPRIERRTNHVAKLFRAVRAWHFLTKTGLAFLILGTVELLARPEDPGQGGGWVFGSLVFIIAGAVTEAIRGLAPGR